MSFKGISNASSKGPPPTEAQLDYLYDLCDKHGISRDVRRVDRLKIIEEASAMIDELKQEMVGMDADDSVWDLEGPF